MQITPRIFKLLPFVTFLFLAQCPCSLDCVLLHKVLQPERSNLTTIVSIQLILILCVTKQVIDFIF